MTLQEALRTNKKVRLPHSDECIQLFRANTGPHRNLVDCDYFMVYDTITNEEYFSTALDLYPEDIFSDAWEIYSG